jgi:hypothetical protein
MPAQNYRIALLVIIAAITLPVFSAEPAPVPVLNQTRLDRFVNEVEAITADSIIASAWDTAYQSASMEVLMNPDSAIMSGDMVSAVYALLLKTRDTVKFDAAANAALKQKGWTTEFWDIFATVSIGLHYASIVDFNTAVADPDTPQPGTIPGLPDIKRFLHPNDWDLIKKNYSALFARVGEEIDKNNGW